MVRYINKGTEIGHGIHLSIYPIIPKAAADANAVAKADVLVPAKSVVRKNGEENLPADLKLFIGPPNMLRSLSGILHPSQGIPWHHLEGILKN